MRSEVVLAAALVVLVIAVALLVSWGMAQLDALTLPA